MVAYTKERANEALCSQKENKYCPAGGRQGSQDTQVRTKMVSLCLFSCFFLQICIRFIFKKVTEKPFLLKVLWVHKILLSCAVILQENSLALKARSVNCVALIWTVLFLWMLLTHILRVTSKQSPSKWKSSGKCISEDHSQVIIHAYYTFT
jgi:hypothetical protein